MKSLSEMKSTIVQVDSLTLALEVDSVKVVASVDSVRHTLTVDTVRLLEEVFPVAYKLFRDYSEHSPKFIGKAKSLVIAYLIKKASYYRTVDYENVFANKLTECLYDEYGKPRPRVKIIEGLHKLAENVRGGIRNEIKKGRLNLKTSDGKIVSVPRFKVIRKRRKDEESEFLDAGDLPDPRIISDTGILLIAMIDIAVQSLPLQQRKALIMAKEGFEGKEIAAELDITKGRVSQLLTEARKSIKKITFK